MARATFLIKLLVLCMLVPGALCNKNSLNGSPCDNTVNGNTTSSTDVDGNIIVGCGNTVSNITSDGATAVTVDITGSDNVAEDDVIRNGDGEFTIVGNRNEVLNDEADYIDLYKSNNNLIENNIATDSAIEFDYANGNTLLNNVANYFDLYNSSNNLIENNTATDDGIEFDHANGNTLLNNVADYFDLYNSSSNLVESNQGVRGLVGAHPAGSAG
jgi:parallel beta-helix repeat protein